MEFCKLNEKLDDVSKVVICSGHFVPADYVNPMAKTFGGILKLKQDSVPSIRRPNHSETTTAVLSEVTTQTVGKAQACKFSYNFFLFFTYFSNID